MKLRLRVFKITDEHALRLSNRATLSGEYAANLARKYLDEFLADPTVPDVLSPIKENSKIVLRSYYLTEEQDIKLSELAEKLQVTKGELFRKAIHKGLG